VAKKSEDKEVTVDAKILAYIEKIRTFQGNIDSFVSRIKVIDEQLLEMAENTDEYTEVVRANDALKLAQENLKERLSRVDGYNNLMEERADEREALKTAKLNLSDFLLGYYHDTGERQIETSPKEAREVILTGRLGKERKFQTSLFGVKENK
jgi:regulator of replication initiation timing